MPIYDYGKGIMGRDFLDMKKEQEEEQDYTGGIGYNVPPSEEEKAEDLLELLYLWWGEGRPLTVIDVVLETGMKKREVNALIKKLVKYGYLAEPSGNAVLQLTDFGKGQGAECASRHEKLVQFLQLVSGMDEEEASEDACRLEHVISKKGIQGISNFLKYGDVYDRVIKNPDLQSMYGEGRHEMCMGIYYAERRQPRILAKEFGWFEDEVVLEVKDRSGVFLLKLNDMDCACGLWYRREDTWEKAEKTEDGYRIPARIFSYHISAAVPVTEATAIIAFPEGEQKPAVMDCRELNIHLW